MLDLDQKLSEHFTLRELLHSPTADALHFDEQYTPTDEVISNLTVLCVEVLEPLRAAISFELGKDTAIIITSGYRCLRVNAAVGGVNTPGHLSQHTIGCAADTHVEGMTIEAWYQFIRRHARLTGFKFGQLIQEFNNWAHISRDPFDIQRCSTLRATRINGIIHYASDPL